MPRANDCILLDEVAGGGAETVVGDVESLIVTIEEVEGFGDEFKTEAFVDSKNMGETDVGGHVVGARKRVAFVAGEAVVRGVAVRIGIAGDHGIGWSSAAVGQQ